MDRRRGVDQFAPEKHLIVKHLIVKHSNYANLKWMVGDAGSRRLAHGARLIVERRQGQRARVRRAGDEQHAWYPMHAWYQSSSTSRFHTTHKATCTAHHPPAATTQHHHHHPKQPPPIAGWCVYTCDDTTSTATAQHHPTIHHHHHYPTQPQPQPSAGQSPHSRTSRASRSRRTPPGPSVRTRTLHSTEI